MGNNPYKPRQALGPPQEPVNKNETGTDNSFAYRHFGLVGLRLAFWAWTGFVALLIVMGIVAVILCRNLFHYSWSIAVMTIGFALVFALGFICQRMKRHLSDLGQTETEVKRWGGSRDF